MPKLPPEPDAGRLARVRPDLVALAPHSTLWRIHTTAGPHARAWSDFRRFGPIGTCRFDPHDPPPHAQDEGVLYTALDVTTATAEHFQDRRVIDRLSRRPHLVGFRLQRSLRLLDLSGTWPLRAGASHTINTGAHASCRSWARAIRRRWPDLDGLWHTSSMTAQPCATLWNPAVDALPELPDLNLPLAHTGLDETLEVVADVIGYDLP